MESLKHVAELGTWEERSHLVHATGLAQLARRSPAPSFLWQLRSSCNLPTCFYYTSVDCFSFKCLERASLPIFSPDSMLYWYSGTKSQREVGSIPFPFAVLCGFNHKKAKFKCLSSAVRIKQIYWPMNIKYFHRSPLTVFTYQSLCLEMQPFFHRKVGQVANRNRLASENT